MIRAVTLYSIFSIEGLHQQTFEWAVAAQQAVSPNTTHAGVAATAASGGGQRKTQEICTGNSQIVDQLEGHSLGPVFTCCTGKFTTTVLRPMTAQSWVVLVIGSKTVQSGCS